MTASRRTKLPTSHGTVNSPARVGVQGEDVFGVFYRGGERHIATYVPYSRPPHRTLCNREAGVPTREVANLCESCVSEAGRILGELRFK